MNVCPEKNSKAWKLLVTKLGSEELAYKAYLANNNEIPTLDDLSDEKFEDVFEDKLLKPKFQAVLDNLIQKKDKLNKNLNVQKDKLKNSTGEEKSNAYKFYKAIQKQIESIDEQINKISKLDTSEDIIKHAYSQLEEISNLLSNTNISENDFTHAKNTINLWNKAGDFTNDENIFLNEEEIESSKNKDSDFYDIRQKLILIKDRANILSGQWVKKRENIINNWLNTDYGKSFKVSFKDVIKDVGLGNVFLLDISKSDYILAQAMYDWNAKASMETSKEAHKVIKGLGEVFEKVYKKYNKKKLYDMFSQEFSNTDKRKTGDLVYRFSQHYFDTLYDLSSKFKSIRDKALNIEDEEERKNYITTDYKEYINEYKKLHNLLDVRKLFPNRELYDKEFSEKETNEHKQELINTLGQIGYLEHLEKASNKIERYKSDREFEIDEIKDKHEGDEAGIQREIQKWDLENSPYYFAEQWDSDFKHYIGGKSIISKSYNVETVPRKIVDEKNTEFYDNKFKVIEGDKELYGLYQYIVETLQELNNYLSEDLKGELQVNTLPKLKKNILELFSGGENINGIKGIWDAFKEAQREGVGSTIESTTTTDIEGNKIRSLNTDFLYQDNQRIKDYVERKQITEEITEENTNPLVFKKLKRQWTKEIKSIIAEESTFDIEKLVKIYSLSAISYKHKSKIEDAMQLSHSFIKDLVKSKENLSGETMKDQFGNIINNYKSPENLIKQLDYFMDNFYGDKKQAVELATEQKIYTEEENKIKSELKELLKREDIDDDNKILLYKQLNRLGGYRTGGKLIDMGNQYIRMKGLAWNPFSAIINASIGYISNSIEASGGRVFTQNGLLKGYKETLTNSKKVEAIMEKYSILEEIQSEIYTSPKYKKSKGWIEPFGLQHKTEMLNQSPIMIAILSERKIKLNGKEVSFYDALDNEGNFKEGIELDYNQEFKVIESIKEAIKDIHGNYDKDAPILANKYILGRSLLVFRKWMINSYYNRLGKERYSMAKELTDKGRWLSYGTYFKEYGLLVGTRDVALNFLKKLTFGVIKTNFDEKLSEVDAANMRKNLTELMFIMSISALAMMLKALSNGDDDDHTKFLCFFWINELTRMQTDMLFYSDPQQFKTILRDPLPIASLITDVEKALAKSINLVTGGEDIYKQGSHKGQSKTWVSTKKLIPGVSLGDRFKSLYSQIFDKQNYLLSLVDDSNK